LDGLMDWVAQSIGRTEVFGGGFPSLAGAGVEAKLEVHQAKRIFN
jgi:hypothetical protein